MFTCASNHKSRSVLSGNKLCLYLYYSRINSLLDREGLQIIYDWKHKLFVVISVI